MDEDACVNLYKLIDEEDSSFCKSMTFDKNIAFTPVPHLDVLKTTKQDIDTYISSNDANIQAENKKKEDEQTSEKRLNTVEDAYKQMRIIYYAFIVLLVVLLLLFLLSLLSYFT